MLDSCRKIFDGKAIELREKGMGKHKNNSDLLTSYEEEQIWKLKSVEMQQP